MASTCQIEFPTKKGSDPETWSDIYAFSIAPDGSIAKHLVLPQVEKTSQKAASPVSLIKLNDGSLFVLGWV